MIRSACEAAAITILMSGMVQAHAPMESPQSGLPSGARAVIDIAAIAGHLPPDPIAQRPRGDEVILARGGRGGGGARAAAPRQPGGHSAGQARSAERQGSVDRDVDIDIDTGNDPNRIIEDDAVRGAVVGVTVGAAIASSDEPTYSCPDENGDGVCDDNVAN